MDTMTKKTATMMMAFLINLMFLLKPVVNLIKHFTIIIYNSRVVLTRKFPILLLWDHNYSGVIIYTRKMFIRLATGFAGINRCVR